MSRREILERLTGAVTDGPAVPLPERVPDFPEFSDPVERFRTEAEAVGTRVYEADDAEELALVLSRVLEQTGSEELWWPDPEVAERWQLADSAERSAGPVLAVSRHSGGEVVLPIDLRAVPYEDTVPAAAPVSICSALFGIAETGSVLESSRRAGRIFPILTPVHVVLISRRKILMNLSLLFSDTERGEKGSAELLMTGPSRTADIEKILILGVHGPRELIFILTP